MSSHTSVWCSLLLVGALYSLLNAQAPTELESRRDKTTEEVPACKPDPYPNPNLPHHGTPAALRSTADRFAQSYECPMCRGSGKMNETVKGAKGRTIDVRCDMCRGSRYTDSAIILQDLEQLVLAWARLDGSHAEAPAAMDNAVAILKRASALNHSKFREIINEQFKHANFRENFVFTNSVFFIGTINKAAELPGGDQRSFVTSVANIAGKKPFQAVVVTPGFVEAHHDKVLVAGIYVGEMSIPPFERVAVLRNGFIVGVH